MCAGGQNCNADFMERYRDVRRFLTAHSAQKAVDVVSKTGSVRAIDLMRNLLLEGSGPFSGEERLHRAASHFNPTGSKTPLLDRLKDIVEASGEEAEQVLEQIEMMCGRGMLDGNAEQRVTEILNAVRAGGVIAVNDLRKSWET